MMTINIRKKKSDTGEHMHSLPVGLRVKHDLWGTVTIVEKMNLTQAVIFIWIWARRSWELEIG